VEEKVAKVIWSLGYYFLSREPFPVAQAQDALSVSF
jgi:hypothetical protein